MQVLLLLLSGVGCVLLAVVFTMQLRALFTTLLTASIKLHITIIVNNAIVPTHQNGTPLREHLKPLPFLRGMPQLG